MFKSIFYYNLFRIRKYGVFLCSSGMFWHYSSWQICVLNLCIWNITLSLSCQMFSRLIGNHLSQETQARGFCDYSLLWYALFRLRTLSGVSKIFELCLVSLRPSEKFWNLHSCKLSSNWTRSAVIACLKWLLHSDIYFPNLFHGIKSLNTTNSS